MPIVNYIYVYSRPSLSAHGESRPTGITDLPSARSRRSARLAREATKRTVRVLTQVASAQRARVRVRMRDGRFDDQRERLFGERAVGVTLEVRRGQRARQRGIAVAAKRAHRLHDQPGIAVSPIDRGQARARGPRRAPPRATQTRELARRRASRVSEDLSSLGRPADAARMTWRPLVPSFASLQSRWRGRSDSSAEEDGQRSGA